MSISSNIDDRDVVTVGELTRLIKQDLETRFKGIWVEGEVTNYRGAASSGHVYFGMRDEQAKLDMVMWRGTASSLVFEPEDGMKVLAFGSITVYPPHGKYQFDVRKLEPQGVGALQLAFEKMKRKLFEEGLFDDANKKPLNRYPRAVGVVTSPTGAVIRDILNVSRRRCPWVDIYILPVAVQGKGAAQQVASAIDWANQNCADKLDTLIVARGGGSLEDLWAFNEEPVARAIASSGIPVISAVGHEVDYSISDFVADVRAPTPSAAAEIMSVGSEELFQRLKGGLATLEGSMLGYLRDGRDKVKAFEERLQRVSPVAILKQHIQRVDELSERLKLVVGRLLQSKAEMMKGMVGRLHALSPLAILGRGYAAAFTSPGNKLIKSYKDVKKGDAIEVRLGAGKIKGTVDDTSA